MSIVTLLTDFGTVDGYVGAVKGVVLRAAPSATVIDISHNIRRHDVAAAAFALAQAAPHFPAGTVHVVVVDPGVGGRRRPVVVDDGRYRFVAPDNGVVSLAAPEPVAVHAIEAADFRAARPSPTFHGRDVFAVAAGQLAAGRSATEAGPAVALEGSLGLERERRDEHGQYTRIIHVDVFGNLITDLAAEHVPGGARFRMGGYEIGSVAHTFESVARGELLAYIGSGGTLEIAVREGNAAEELDVARGATVEVIDGNNVGNTGGNTGGSSS